MKLLLVVLLVATAVCADTYTSAEWEALKTISHSNFDFSNSLYKVLSRKEGNLIFSPVSIHTILSLTSLGARGTTAQQMVHGLHLPADDPSTDSQTIKDGFRHLTAALHSNPEVTLKVANKIYTDRSALPTAEFAETAKNDFHSSSESIDFQHNPDEARRAVNAWVEEHTDHKIKDLLEEESVKSNTIMILANAVYFKGNWKTKFETAKTTTKPFHVSPETTKDVPMMHINVEASFGYKSSDVLNADILEIPYVGDKVSLVIILPKERHGLADVEARLAELTLSNATANARLSRPQVKLSLPKFKLEVGLDLQDTLEQMGMTDMFGDTADFSGLTPVPTLISKVAHKAFIEVNEEGTEAAAATGVVGISRSHRQLPQVTFNADHPFMFFLVNTEKHDNVRERTILFMGRYSSP